MRYRTHTARIVPVALTSRTPQILAVWPSKSQARCSCGWHSTNRRTSELAWQAAAHHLTGIALTDRDNCLTRVS